MLDFISTLLNNLLPSKEQDNFSWTLRIIVLAIVSFVFIASGVNLMLDTTLGKQYGIQRNVNLPNLTHASLLNSRQEIWHIISRLRYNDDNVRAAFVLSVFDKKTGNFVLDDKLKPEDTELGIWEWELPVRKFSSLDLIKGLLNLKQQEIEENVRRNRECYTASIEKEYLIEFKRAIPDFVSTHMSFCPLYTLENPRLIAITMILFRPAPPLQPQDYEERLKDATTFARRYFKEFDVRYEFIYD